MGEFALIFRDRWMSIVKKMKIKEERGRQTREREEYAKEWVEDEERKK